MSLVEYNHPFLIAFSATWLSWVMMYKLISKSHFVRQKALILSSLSFNYNEQINL